MCTLIKLPFTSHKMHSKEVLCKSNSGRCSTKNQTDGDDTLTNHGQSSADHATVEILSGRTNMT